MEPKVLHEFRVTKYNPANRDSSGAYLRDEWICHSQIGESFDGVILTAEEYQRVEDAYVTTALAFLEEARVSELIVSSLENHGNFPLSIIAGVAVALPDVGDIIRQLLRGTYWCRLQIATAFVHIGYDYYMYVGVPVRCPRAESLARELNLFVEQWRSPYHEILM
jgi:hypothetical protein